MSLKHLLLSGSFLLMACGGGSGSSAPTSSGEVVTPPPPPPPPQAATKIDTPQEASRFLTLAGFGENEDDINAFVGQNAEDWLAAQLDMPHASYLDQTNIRLDLIEESGPKNRAHSIGFWKRMIAAPDQLRHRMVYALSQIIVVSDQSITNPKAMAFYMDVLGNNAFGNYKNILQDVTYAPAMADYLTYLNNKKANEDTGRMPDENYAREILQLFSIGLNELNMDGTLKLDSSGNPIPTFTNEDIGGLAKVFTGLTLDHEAAEEWWDKFAFPLIINERNHSERAKVFLGKTIPENTDAETSINRAINIIFEHPNVAPFISRQLIQRFTASNPEPAYVERVANVFETGTYTGPDGTIFGSTGRGDLSATLAAILLDESQFDDSEKTAGSGDLTDIGKIREPVLNFVHWAKAFNVTPVTTEIETLLIWNVDKTLGQAPLGSLSVFNFYRPGFVPGGTLAGAQNLTVPEMQLVNAASHNGYIDFMTKFIMDRSYTISDDKDVVSFKPDYTALLENSEDVPHMIEYLDKVLTSGRMRESTKTNITDLMAELPIRTDALENELDDKLLRAELAVLVTVTSPEYMTQQ